MHNISLPKVILQSIFTPDELPAFNRPENCNLRAEVRVVRNLNHRLGSPRSLLLPKALLLASRDEDAVEAALSVVMFESAPISVLEEGVSLDLLGPVHTDPFSWYPAQQPRQEILELCAHRSWNLQRALLDVLVEGLEVFLVEGRPADTEFVQDSSQSVPIHILAIAQPADYLRRQVGMRAAKRV